MDRRRQIYELQAELCKALAHPKRLEILDVLRTGEYAVEEIAQKTEMQKSNLSQHLAVLRKANLVTTRRSGLYIYYRLAQPRLMEACDILQRVLLQSLTQGHALATSFRTSDATETP